MHCSLFWLQLSVSRNLDVVVVSPITFEKNGGRLTFLLVSDIPTMAIERDIGDFGGACNIYSWDPTHFPLSSE